MTRRAFGATGLQVHPPRPGGDVLGWPADGIVVATTVGSDMGLGRTCVERPHELTLGEDDLNEPTGAGAVA